MGLTKNKANKMLNKGHRFYVEWGEGDVLFIDAQTFAEAEAKCIEAAGFQPNRIFDLAFAAYYELDLE